MYFVPPSIDVQNATKLLVSQYTSAIQAPISQVTTPSSVNTDNPHTDSASIPLSFSQPKLHIARELQPALEQIQTNTYGSSMLNQILKHPNLYALTIQPHAQSSAERERLGVTPSATTELTFYDSGQLSATITMDDKMLAQVMTPSGQGITVDTDNILFHELSHVLLELNDEVDRSNRETWQHNAEVVASEYESNYGGYERDYFREGNYAFWA